MLYASTDTAQGTKGLSRTMNARVTDPHLRSEMCDRQARLSEFIRTATGRTAHARIGKRYAGGFSWQTYALEVSLGEGTSGQQETLNLILRVGHVNGLLSPYSTVPEALVFEALEGSAVPVPHVLWHTDDTSVIGSPFLVMSKAPGTEKSPFIRDADSAMPQASLGEHFVDILAALHNHSWQSTAAARLQPRPDPKSAAELQVDKWAAMIEESGIRPRPVLHYTRSWLRANAPEAPRVCIVHGDYRAGNFLQSDGRITAVLDWELVHLGDPHEDIAWAGLRLLSARTALVSGLVSREDFSRRYESATGIRIASKSLRYYEVLGLYKICAMNLRAAGRVESGTAPDARMTSLGLGLSQIEVEIARLLAKES